MAKKRIPTELVPAEIDDASGAIQADVTDLLASAHRAAARTLNSLIAETSRDPTSSPPQFPLAADVQRALHSASPVPTGRIRQPAGRHATPLLKLAHEVESLAARGHAPSAREGRRS
jgi:hypothetical protein